MILPVFPLRGVFLFPGAILPLHIFEPRYRQMIDDLMDTAGRLVIATTFDEPSIEDLDRPNFHPVGGLGEISGHERLDDGRYLIALYGLDRVRIEEVESDRLYRQVRAESLEERPFAAGAETEYRNRIEDELRRRAGSSIEIPEDLPTERLVDVLLMQSAADADTMARAYGMSDLGMRAEAALTFEPAPTGIEGENEEEEGNED